MKKYLTATILALSATTAQAEVPAAITSALNTALTDGVAVAALALTVIVAIHAFKYMRRGL